MGTGQGWHASLNFEMLGIIAYRFSVIYNIEHGAGVLPLKVPDCLIPPHTARSHLVLTTQQLGCPKGASELAALPPSAQSCPPT